MEEDAEYLTAWPPPGNGPRLDNSEELSTAIEVSSLSDTIASGSPPPLKRFKYEHIAGVSLARPLNSQSSCSKNSAGFCVELQQQLSPEELHDIVQCDYSVSADALLARWWKIVMSKKATDRPLVARPTAEEERVVLIINSNAGPQTKLYHISRYSACYRVAFQ